MKKILLFLSLLFLYQQNIFAQATDVAVDPNVSQAMRQNSEAALTQQRQQVVSDEAVYQDTSGIQYREDGTAIEGTGEYSEVTQEELYGVNEDKGTLSSGDGAVNKTGSSCSPQMQGQLANLRDQVINNSCRTALSYCNSSSIGAATTMINSSCSASAGASASNLNMAKCLKKTNDSGVNQAVGVVSNCTNGFSACYEGRSRFQSTANQMIMSCSSEPGMQQSLEAVRDGGLEVIDSEYLSKMQTAMNDNSFTAIQAALNGQQSGKIMEVIKGKGGWKSAALYGAAGLGAGYMLFKGDDKDKGGGGNAAGDYSDYGSVEYEGKTCLTYKGSMVTGYCYSDSQLIAMCEAPNTIDPGAAFNPGLAAQLEAQARANGQVNGQEALKAALCTPENLAKAGGDSGSGGETCDTTAPNYYTNSACYGTMMAQCTADATVGDCSAFRSHFCGGDGAGRNFCVYQDAKDYCASGGKSTSPSCQWVMRIRDESTCQSNIDHPNCYINGSLAGNTNYCNTLGISTTDPVCKNLNNPNFFTSYNSPTNPSDGSAPDPGSEPTPVGPSNVAGVNPSQCQGQNAYNSACLQHTCAQPNHQASPPCQEFIGNGTRTLASAYSALPSDIDVNRDVNLLDAGASSLPNRMCSAGQVVDCGPLEGHSP